MIGMREYKYKTSDGHTGVCMGWSKNWLRDRLMNELPGYRPKSHIFVWNPAKEQEPTPGRKSHGKLED